MMKMKNFLRKDSDGVRRLHPVRTSVICVLIAVLMISASISMGYSKYVFQSSPHIADYQVKYYSLPTDLYVTLPKDSATSGNYSFVSPDSNVRITYPKSSGDETYATAEYVTTFFNPALPETDYTAHSNQIDLRYEIGLSGVNHEHPLELFGLKSVVNNAAKGIVVYIKVGTDADPASIKPSLRYVYPDSVNCVTSNVASHGQVAFSSFGQLYRISDEGDLVNSRFEIQYDKLAWSEYVDTDWYDSDPDDPEYWITTAAELAGLAEIVNSGIEDFEGKTIYLNENISLADDDGYLRRWTPIGTKDNPFKGTFDGQNHSISGLNVADFGASGYYSTAGLFGYISGDTMPAATNDFTIGIKDLTISTAYVSAYLYEDPTADTLLSAGAAGVLAGWVEGYYQIDNVAIENANLCGIATCAGYLLGRCDAGTTFTNCTADADCVDTAGGFSAVNQVDGLVGYQAST